MVITDAGVLRGSQPCRMSTTGAATGATATAATDVAENSSAAAVFERLLEQLDDPVKICAITASHAGRVQLAHQLLAPLASVTCAHATEHGIEAVSVVVGSDIRMQPLLVDLGAVSTVLRAMETNIEAMAIQMRGCHAIASLAPQFHRSSEVSGEWTQWAADNVGYAAAAVISAMGMFFAEARMQEAGCHALVALLHLLPVPSLAMERAVAVLVAPATRAVFGALLRHRADSALCEAALWLLHRCISHDSLARHAGLAISEYAGVQHGSRQMLPSRAQKTSLALAAGELEEHIVHAATDALSLHVAAPPALCWAGCEVLRCIFGRGKHAKVKALGTNAVQCLVRAVGKHCGTALRPRCDPGPPLLPGSDGDGDGDSGGLGMRRQQRPRPCVAVAGCGALRALLHRTRDGGATAAAVAGDGEAILVLVRVVNCASVLEADLAALALSTLSELGP